MLTSRRGRESSVGSGGLRGETAAGDAANMAFSGEFVHVVGNTRHVSILTMNGDSYRLKQPRRAGNGLLLLRHTGLKSDRR